LKEANEFVAQHHRHNLPTVGDKFAVGAAQDGKPLGVAIADSPVCRRLDDGNTWNSFGLPRTANACSFLYSRCAKIARLMGYSRIIPTRWSPRVAHPCGRSGAEPTGPLEAHEWANPNRPRKSQQVYHYPRYRWDF
jgi:hypothetical protein